jgi:hypothetical protein
VINTPDVSNAFISHMRTPMKRRFSDWRNYCCILYRAEYKYSGFATGKVGKYEGDSGNGFGGYW